MLKLPFLHCHTINGRERNTDKSLLPVHLICIQAQPDLSTVEKLS